MKYIDAEKLIANLRRQKRELELSIQSQGDFGQSCHIIAYENILSLIASIQQEQPDIEKEIDKLWKGLNTGHEYVIVYSYQDFLGICLHCFELGLNARK